MESAGGDIVSALLMLFDAALNQEMISLSWEWHSQSSTVDKNNIERFGSVILPNGPHRLLLTNLRRSTLAQRGDFVFLV